MILLDGGYGSLLSKYGLKSGENPGLFGLHNPEILKTVYKNYIDAGAKIVKTNTFATNPISVPSNSELVEIITSNVENLAKLDKPKDVKVALDIGSLGEILKPLGTLDPFEALDHFKTIIKCANDKFDIILFETFTDLLELKMGILAAKELTNKPVFASMSLDETGKSFSGNDIESVLLTLSSLGVETAGFNCSLGPKELLPIAKTTKKLTLEFGIKSLIMPNAGIPKLENGKTIYPLNPVAYYKEMEPILNLGIDYIGGCCGTEPEYIKELSKFKSEVRVQDTPKKRLVITSGRSTVELGKNFIKVGESINPSSSKALKEDLIDGSLNIVKQLAVKQNNADVIDVNLSVGELRNKEDTLFLKSVPEIQVISDKPLQFDSSNPDALRAACRIYSGVPIINSVEMTKKSYEKVLPIAKEFGAYLIFLPIDENGIPKTVDERIGLLEKIISIAKNDYGIEKEKFIYDPLVFSIATNPNAMEMVIEGIKRASKLGVMTSVGLSNISFGMPNRSEINGELLDKAKENGLSMAIMSVFGKKAPQKVVEENIDNKTVDNLIDAIVFGLEEQALEKANELLDSQKPLEIIENNLIPALDIVGSKFEKKEVYLPALLKSAETAIKINAFLSTKFETKNVDSAKSIIMATVKDDIHDIGKNIVALVLKANGYKVFDLGKDCDPMDIIECLKNHKIDYIGLSALMTTTLESMEKTIKIIRDSGFKQPIFVGGAVLNENIAKEIGADYYTKGPVELIELLKSL